MEMNIKPELLANLEARGLTVDDMIRELFSVLCITHTQVGMYAGTPQEMTLGIDNMLQLDIQSTGTIPRSLLERLLIRFKMQYAMDKHNYELHKANPFTPEQEEARRKAGFGDLEAEGKGVAAQEVWIWTLQTLANIVEHRGMESMLQHEEWMRKRQQQGEEPTSSE